MPYKVVNLTTLTTGLEKEKLHVSGASLMIRQNNKWWNSFWFKSKIEINVSWVEIYDFPFFNENITYPKCIILG